MPETMLARNELIALLTLVFGVIVAGLVSMATQRLLEYLEQRSARFTSTDEPVFSSRLVKATRAAVFWLIVILSVGYALQLLGSGDLSSALDSVLVFIPSLLVAFAIMVAGHLLGLLASHTLASHIDQATPASFGPRLAYGLIMVIAIVLGLAQINVDITFITRLLLIGSGIVLSGMMLAFALGAKQHVANLLAARELSRISKGDRLRVEGVEGEVVGVHSTGVEIAIEGGVVNIPAATFAQSQVVHLGPATADE